MAQDEAFFGKRYQGMEASGEANCRRWKLVAQSLETKRVTETDDPYEVHATFPMPVAAFCSACLRGEAILGLVGHLHSVKRRDQILCSG